MPGPGGAAAAPGRRDLPGVPLLGAAPQLRRDAVHPGAGDGLVGRHGAAGRVRDAVVVAGQFLRVGQQPAVERAAVLQFLVGADVDQAALVQHGDAVGQRQGGAAVGDQHGGAAAHHLAQRVVDLRLDPGVHRRGGVVEQQQPRVGEHRAGQGDALALAARQGQALLADHGVVPGGQRGDEPVGLGGPGGGEHPLLAGVLAAVEDVGAHAVGEQEAVLRHQADRAAQRGEGEVAHVGAADPHRAAGHVVEARQQQGDGGLAGAGGADDGHGLAGPHPQAEVVEHRVLAVVAEGHVVELDVGVGVLGQFAGVGRLGDLRLGVDQLVDPLDAGAGLLADGEHGGQHPDRAGELGEVGGEGDEGAQRDLALGRHPAAEREHRDLAERRDRLQGRVVAGVEPHGAQPGGEQQAADPAQLVLLLRLLAEALDHPDAGDRAVDHPGDRGGLALRVPGGGEEPGAAAVGQEPQGGRDGQRDDGQQRREHRHDDQRQHEQQHVADHHRQHEEHALDELEVAGGAADHLAGVERVLAGAVEAGDGAEHRGPQVVLDVEGEASAVVAPHEGGHVDGERRQDHQAGPGPERAGVVDDDVVDDQPRQQRHECHDRHAGQ